MNDIFYKKKQMMNDYEDSSEDEVVSMEKKSMRRTFSKTVRTTGMGSKFIITDPNPMSDRDDHEVIRL